MRKLDRALTWLISINHFYKDDKAYFETTSNITPLVQIAENSIPEEGGIASETSSNHYITLNDNKAIYYVDHFAKVIYDLVHLGVNNALV